MNYYTIVIIGGLLFFASCNTGPIETISKSIHTVGDIESIDSSLVKPYDYTSVVSLKDLTVKEKKQKYIDMVLPAILVAKVKLQHTKNEVQDLISKDTSNLSNKQKTFLYDLLKKYKTKNFDALLMKLNTHPNSIVLAQSAIESGWGTSRFFLEANNIFGVWSFNKNDNRIKAKELRNGKATYLKKYSSLSQSMEDYFLTIGRGPYSDFRLERTKTNNPYKLVTYLLKYSELGEEYVRQLQHVIRKNDLTKYDNYQIDPKYINEDNLSIKKIEEKFEFEEEFRIEQKQDTLLSDSLKQDTISSEKKTIIQNEHPKVQKKETSQTATGEFKSDLPDFGKTINIQEKKRQFFNFMRPFITAESNIVISEREFVKEMQVKFNSEEKLSAYETKKLEEMAVRYRIKQQDISKSKAYKDLLLHVDIIPTELALTQAALESAWGTSYFARKVNNIYGQWCFTPGCGIVPKRRPADESHELAIFEDVSHSVKFYMQYLNSHPLFSKLRKARLKNRKNNIEPNAYDMAGGLSAYSARGKDYISELRSMIVSNKKTMEVE